MLKIAFISDIHGNMPALEAVLEDLYARKISQIYCLGDLVGYYCYFNEVVNKIRDLNIPCLLGNHDNALINNQGIIERSRTCTNILQWQLRHARRETLTFLKSLPSHFDINYFNHNIKIVHAGLEDFIDEYLFDVNDDYLTKHNFYGDILISGHTHLTAYKRFFSGKAWYNPGSVGQPRDGIAKASYLIIDKTLSPQFVRVGYDYKKVIKAMKENGFDDYISIGLKTGKKL